MKDDEGKSKGFGFVNYEKSEDAHAAVEKLNGHKQGETEWEVTKAQKKAEREAELKAKFEKDKREKQDKLAESNLYIKNLDDSQTDDKLRQLFEEFGTIMSCKVLRDPNTGISRGVGFVQLSTPEEATKAINEMNTKLVNNKPLYVAIAQKKSDRQRRLKTYFQQPQANFQNPQGMGMGMPFYGPGPQTNMNGPMGYGYPNQYGGPMSGMGGNMRPAYGTPNGMPGGMMPGMGRPPMMNNYNNYGGVWGQEAGVTLRAAWVLVHEGLQGVAEGDSDQRRTMLGEELYPLVLNMEPDLAGKITGMLLEMSEGDVIAIIEDHVACQDKVGEAKRVLIQSGQVPGDENSNVAGAMAGLAISA
ncbi:hypothetical protein WJX79_006571 [Trebouxia sp. C0005]